MRRHVLSNLDDLDLEARELARAAARRAGLSLEDWAAAVLGRAQDDGESPHAKLARQSDAKTRLMGQSTRRPPSRDYEALMAAAAAESERQSHERTSRTAIALESMASWIEQAEERLNETSRASVDHQDRATSVLSGALSSLKERLDRVERHVVSERAAPARVEFPIQDALKALAPLSDTLVGLRTDVSRLAERLEQPAQAWAPAVDGIRTEIEHLGASIEGLATHEEIAALDDRIKDLTRELEQGHSSKDLLTLASSIAALYRQIQSLSEEVSEGLHRRIGSEIDLIKGKVDAIAETGIDRTVIDFLSSQIVDMRQDLAHRAEPQQIERLSGDVAALSRQMSDLRAQQVGRSDFSALKTSLENICSALGRTVAAQEASDVPGQIESLSQRLDSLASRPQPEPANLDPITDQLALLTERMAGLSSSRLEQADALTEMIHRLSSQVEAVANREPPSQEPLMRRFDRIEDELRQVGRQADTSTVELMLRSIDERLERAPDQSAALDALERRIMALADQVAQTSNEPFRKALGEVTGHLKNLQTEAEGIAERAAKAALRDLRPNLPAGDDVDVLKQGFVELKALHTRADKKTQQTLRAVHEALETLVSRFPGQVTAARPSEGALPVASDRPARPLQPADRLEAAVRRLHAAALSQIEEVSGATAHAAAPDAPAATPPEAAPVEPEPVRPPVPRAAPAPDDADLSAIRVSFIAAARRAAQPAPADPAIAAVPQPPEAEPWSDPDAAPADEPRLSSPSLIDRIRRTFDSHRRPLLFGLAFLILAAGSVQILSGGRSTGSALPEPIAEAALAAVPEAQPAPAPQPAPETAASPPADKSSVFQASSLTTGSVASAPPASAKFLVDPGTVGELPAGVPPILREAALSGDAAAVLEIASLADEGLGISQDKALALRLFERAAQAGLPPAQERLARLYEKGAGLPRDLKLASVWYERAARGGNIRAMHNLATLLASNGIGKPDYAAALRWYGEAAEAGLRDSQFNMGILLARGIGTRQDLAQAFKWFAVAAQAGDAGAAKKRDEIAARLDAAQLDAAKVSAEQWRPRASDPVANEFPLPAKGQTAALDRTAGDRS